MANKPKSKNWNDVQMVIAAVAIALSLGILEHVLHSRQTGSG